ncbi:hypothetical protein [uncultured Eubacterium sp.]|uniref:hypothetical protein n=1 Tax=uncultured Eubacterium sp. TaxID=165185 RepID=UPI0025F90773|nr:hypothetical protein [uncultured Eubacterium sp.]
MISEINTCELMDVKINKSDSRYFLCLTYKYCDKYGNIHERVIDNIPLPLYNHLDNIIIKESQASLSLLNYYTCKTIDVGFGEQDVRPDFAYVDRIVEYAAKEMTIEEIENKLGHKVKIVDKK